MKFYVGVIDNSSFDFLRESRVEDINLWHISNGRRFSAIPQGAPVLLKLRAPKNAIGGVGFFSASYILPLPETWARFGDSNGVPSMYELLRATGRRRSHANNAPNAAAALCSAIVTDPIFFADGEYIPAPADWHDPISLGKLYDADTPSGGRLWDAVQSRLESAGFFGRDPVVNWDFANSPDELYLRISSRVRLGMASFQCMVIDAFSGSCAVSGTRTPHVLRVAQIRPFADGGPRAVSNGLPLRADLYALFDCGLITVTPELRIEISGRLADMPRGNGDDYRKLHGQRLAFLPSRLYDMPDRAALEWRYTHIFDGGA